MALAGKRLASTGAEGLVASASGGGHGFQVVLSDLLAASVTFRTEAAAYQAIIPAGGPACPDGGDAAFNQALQAVVQLIGACTADDQLNAEDEP